MLIATAIVLGVALIGAPLVLTNWHVSVLILITCGIIILFYQALRITAQTPGERSRIGGPRDGAVAALSGHCGLSDNGDRTAPGIAAIAAIVVLNRHDFVHQAIVVALLVGVMALNLLTLLNKGAILRHGQSRVRRSSVGQRRNEVKGLHILAGLRRAAESLRKNLGDFAGTVDVAQRAVDGEVERFVVAG